MQTYNPIFKVTTKVVINTEQIEVMVDVFKKGIQLAEAILWHATVWFNSSKENMESIKNGILPTKLVFEFNNRMILSPITRKIPNPDIARNNP